MAQPIEIKKIIKGHEIEVQKSNFSEAGPTQELKDILSQRIKQREDILRFAKYLTSCSLAFLMILVTAVVIARLYDPNLNLISETLLNLLVISVFGQILGVIYIITKSLYDDKNYLDLIKPGKNS